MSDKNACISIIREGAVLAHSWILLPNLKFKWMPTHSTAKMISLSDLYDRVTREALIRPSFATTSYKYNQVQISASSIELIQRGSLALVCYFYTEAKAL